MTTFERPDAIIVGSGAGGSTAAHLLTQRGWNVVVMEKGKEWRAEDFLPLDELHFREHKTLIPRADTDPMTYAGLSDKETIKSERWWEIEMVGGSTMVWDANFPRYTEEDFAVTKYLDIASIPDNKNIDMVDWPWTYDEFHPFFEAAEIDWGVSGKARQTKGKKGAKPWSQEPVRDTYEYPMEPLLLHGSTRFLTETFDKAGMPAYVGPRAINSRTFDSRPGCSYCGYDQFFGCPTNSRANAQNTMLRRASLTGRMDLRTGHCVTRVEHQNGRAKGVWYKTEPNGEEKFLGAKIVILSAQPIQSARLFLLSQVPDPHDMVGHYLAYHTKANLDLTFPKLKPWDVGPGFQPRTAVGTLQHRDLYVINDKKTYLKKGGKFSIYDPYTCIPPLRNIKGASMGAGKSAVWGRELVDYLNEQRSQAGVTFSFTGDAMSIHSNRVELDPVVKDSWNIPVARTYYHHHQYDRDLSKYALDKMVEVMTAAGGVVRKYELQKEENPGYGHVHGCLRAGTKPEKSALDPMCQSWTVKGLYAIDGSFMPTAGASNPSIVMIANAYRVCSQIPKETSA